MKRILIKLTAAVLAAMTFGTVSLSAVCTNTGSDWISRINGNLPIIGNELYNKLVDEAAKGANGFLADVTLAEDLTAVVGNEAYGITANTLTGTATFTSAEHGDMETAAKNALQKALGTTRSNILNEINNTYLVFINDHPECFWLSGYIRSYVYTEYTFTDDGIVSYKVTSYLLLYSKKDSSVFDIRYEEYRNKDAIAEDIKRLDEEVNAIFDLPYVSKSVTSEEKVRAFNKAIATRNSFCTADSPNNASHECLCALIGSTGDSGPVCDGYANAFKVLCDRAGIPCVLVFGTAINKSKAGGSHTWNAVLIDGVWYVVDVAFNDPILQRSTSAISGYENENYILVGDNTLVGSNHLRSTHFPSANIDNDNNTTFREVEHKPLISLDAYDRDEAIRNAMPFKDVHETNIYYAGVEYVFRNNIMNGVAETYFDPSGTLTRAMIVTVLWRHNGAPAQNGKIRFSDVSLGEWYSEAIEWAENNGIVYGMGDGTYAPHSPVTREQALSILKRYSEFRGYKLDHPEYSLSGYSYSEWARDGVSYAKAFDYLHLTRDLTAPATRAEIAEYMRNLFTINSEA